MTRYEAILSEQREACAALAEAGAGPRPLTSHQFQLAMWLADLVAEEIFSFEGAGSASASNGTSGVGSAATRTPIIRRTAEQALRECGK